MVSLKEKLGFLCVWQQGSRQPVLSYNPSWAGAPSGRIISKLISFESLFYHFEIICIIFAFTSALYFSTHMSRLPCGAVGEIPKQMKSSQCGLVSRTAVLLCDTISPLLGLRGRPSAQVYPHPVRTQHPGTVHLV